MLYRPARRNPLRFIRTAMLVTAAAFGNLFRIAADRRYLDSASAHHLDDLHLRRTSNGDYRLFD